MAGTGARLREWWRVHYMNRGFGFLKPGDWRRAEKDHDLARASKLRESLRRAYPSGESNTCRWFVVYRGIPYCAQTYEEAEDVVQRLALEDRVRGDCWPLPEPLWPVKPGEGNVSQQSAGARRHKVR